MAHRLSAPIAILGDPNSDHKQKTAAAAELCDNLDAFITQDTFEPLIDCLETLLVQGTPVFMNLSPEQLRYTLLEIIHRLPLTDILKPYVKRILQLMNKVIRTDNEDNAMLCLKVIIDIHKHFKSVVEDQVQPFLDLVQDIYRNMPQTLYESFESSSAMAIAPTPGNPSAFQSPKAMSPTSTTDASEVTLRTLSRGMYSFKTLTECPIIVVLLFQNYRQCVAKNLLPFTNLIIEMLKLQPAPQAEAHCAAESRGEIHIGVAPAIKNKQLFGEFIVVQVKTMSFLAYIIRSLALREHQDLIPGFVVRLLKDCPIDMSPTRKELLVATRHILSTEYRVAFVEHIDVLLCEKVLIGRGVTAHETLRPLAYSMLADLLHHIREKLEFPQLQKTIQVYSRNLRDSTLAPGIQTMCAKLLLNLIDRIMKLEAFQGSVFLSVLITGRQLLVLILQSFTKRLVALNREFKVFSQKKDIVDGSTFSLESPSRPIRVLFDVSEHETDALKDGRFLFKNLMLGFKTILFGLKNCNPPPPSNLTTTPQQWNDFARGLAAEEINIFSELFREGLEAFQYYSIDHPESKPGSEKVSLLDPATNFVVPSSKEEKDLLETFATLFIHIDPAAFQEIFGSSLGFFFDSMLKNTALLHIPQFFLASEATSPNFAAILLSYLMENFDSLGGSDAKKAAVMIRLFKLAFMAVTLFPDVNETVLQSRIRNIIIRSLQASKTAEQPLNYFLLLRALFRSIGGGRYESLYKEVLPLLEVLLESLSTLLKCARKPNERDLYVELCLTVPVRLSYLLPSLNYLMQPLVYALKGSHELVTQGLRTLELCIDNLNQDFFDPIIAPVIDDLMSALYEHLKPLPHHSAQHSHGSLRILGKLGGRNRRFLSHSKALNYQQNPIAALEVDVCFHGAPNTVPKMDCAKYVDLAVRTLQNSRVDIELKEEAFRLLTSVVKLLLRSVPLPQGFAFSLRHKVEAYFANKTENTTGIALDGDTFGDSVMAGAQRIILKNSLFGCLLAEQVPELSERASEFLTNVYGHFTLLGFEHLLKGQSLRDEFLFDERQEIMMSFDVVVDVIVQGLASDFGTLSKSAMQAIRHLFNSVSLILGSTEHCSRFPMFQTLAKKLCHSCAEENWFQKIGGCSGIRVLLEDLELGDEWFFRHHVDFSRAVLFVLKDMPQESPLSIISQAKELLKFILRRSKTEFSKLSTIIGMLVAELSNSNPIVRSTVQESLVYLAESTGTAIKDLIMPVKDRVFVSIFTKPLRALPLAMQIGYIDAVDFCLSLGEPLLELNDEMMRLLHEVLALADAEDSALVNDGSSLPKYKTETSLAELRIACIKLLSTAISLPDSSAQQNQTKGRTISVFFKSLYAKHPDIVAVASNGLRQVLLLNQKLPKDLLQAGLRPILMNLSDHKRLSTTGLEGLARLLELLTNYFKVEIGRKLLDHLPAWTESNVLHQAALRPLEEHQNIKIVVAIINVFHLLPPTANMFLPDLIDQVLMLEETLRRTQSSPFRLPLYKFLNRYSEETWLFIKARLDDEKYQRLLWQSLSHKISEPLREVVRSNMSEIIQPDGLCSASICGIHVLNSIVQHNPEWLSDQRENMQILLKYLTKAMQQGKLLALEQAFEVFIHLHFQLVKYDSSEVDRLFTLAEAILSVAPGYADLYRTLFMDYAENASQGDKAEIITKCIQLFPREMVSHDVKYFVFHHLLTPQIAANLENSIINKAFVELVHSNIWEPALSDYGKDRLCSSDFLRIELLQLSALIVKNRPSLVKEVRKDVIKFAWNYIKIEDVLTKQAAYVLIAYFIAAFETPVKIVTQIYVALLKSHQADGRILVRQALDLLAAVLPQRLGASTDGRASHWAKWPSRLIQEDGQSVSQLINIYHFMARHADMFYDFRDVYTPHIISSLPKLGFMNSSNTETKALSLDLIELMIRWDPSKPNLRDSIFQHLLQFCLVTDFANRKTITLRALFLLRNLLESRIWPVPDTKLAIFERNLMEYSDTTAPVFASTMETLEIIISNQTESWFLVNIKEIQKLLASVIRIESPPLQGFVLKIVKTFYSIHLSEQMVTDENAKEFELFIVTVVGDLLQSSTNVSLLVGLLSILVEARPDVVDTNLSGLLKVLQKLAKDHIAAEIPSEDISELVLKTVDIARKRISVLGDQRRTFLTVIVQLLEKSTDMSVCHRLFEMIKAWVLDKSEPFPTVKEKTAVLLKIPTLEHKGDQSLINQFLELIIHIYEDDSLARTELTVRLENAFLMGTRAEDYKIRNRFMTIFDNSMSRNVFNRLNYVITLQDWESLATHYWLKQAVQILSGSVRMDVVVQLKSLCISNLASLATVEESSEIMVDGALERYSHRRNSFAQTNLDVCAGDLLEPISRLQHLDVNFAHLFWIDFFPLCWSVIGKRDRSELTKALITLLAREYHIRQMDKRPNVVKTLMEAISCSYPAIHLPSHLTKYLGKTFDTWYVALEQLQSTASLGDSKRDNYLDALAELYALLSEDDFFYGLWRRRCQFTETNTALSYEQIGMWEAAQQMYENAQIKARTGAIPFSESEYELWEDHWVLCAQKLQQWDILTDLAKHENFSELLLECAWRITDWTTDRETLEAALKLICDQPSPRRCVFEAFLALQRAQVRGEASQEFSRICEEGMQLSLQRWNNLPAFVSQAHIPLLQTFQQFVELQEASQIYAGLLSTQAQNLETKSQELKSTLQSWRERLPNTWDDMTAWSDLVAWRQLVFATINRTYMPLVSNLPQSSNSNANSYAYRGYHETAWIINRFAHVARKHQLPGVCINQLTKIYTLPNIEIQEAFLKLREQAKCHYQNPAELSTGLDVISNTNLVYFGVQQKAEFFTLKGMFLAALKMKDEASQAFATAIQIDITLGKAWAEWGRYNDRRFKENPQDLTLACHAVSCYLQAAGIYKNKKSRKILNRVLWLLSLDDQAGSIAKGWESYKGEVPVWYWITYIPQLLTSLSHKEARYARQILIKIAKTYPQALHFQLRTTKEDYTIIKKQAFAAAQTASSRPEPTIKLESSGYSENNCDLPSEQSTSEGIHNGVRTSSPISKGVQAQTRQPWEHVDEIMAILKTAFPLLALSMETMVDQIQLRLKCPPDEDAYRLTVALLNDAIQYVGRAATLTEDSNLPPATEANIVRFSETVVPKSLKPAFERDFIQQNLTLRTYIQRLRQWRDRFELVLDKRQDKQYLEQVSPYLTEFQYQKFDDIEVPGQYLLHKDNNNDFIKILRFLPTLEVVRGNGICYRRLTIRGHDGSLHPFHVQYPAARHCRREERIVQFFRILNSALSTKRESRRRNLQFTLPTAVPLAPHIRIIQDDLSFVSFQGIYEEYCHRTGMHKDDPLKFYTQKVNAFTNEQSSQNLVYEKIEILEEITRSMVSSNMLTNYMRRTFRHFEDYWLFRKQFCYQYATFTFMCYVMHIGNRFPHKISISRATGNIWTCELLPSMAPNSPVFHLSEAVPFRFTANVQNFMGPVGIEGIFSFALMAIAKCLTEPQFELDQYLCIFVRDEMITWFTQQHRPVAESPQLQECVATNVDMVVRRAVSLSQVAKPNIPANQTIIDLISLAVNPKSLAGMDPLWMSWVA